MVREAMGKPRGRREWPSTVTRAWNWGLDVLCRDRNLLRRAKTRCCLPSALETDHKPRGWLLGARAVIFDHSTKVMTQATDFLCRSSNKLHVLVYVVPIL